MTWKEYDKNTEEFFKTKTFIVLEDLHNRRGDKIKKGEEVTISRKYKGFTVKSDTGASISRVGHECLNIKE